MVYRYTGITTDGKEISGIVEAGSIEEAFNTISGIVSVVLEIKEEKRRSVKIKVKRKSLMVFTKLLATALNSGLMLVEALELVQQQVEEENLKSIIISIVNDLKTGKKFSSALSKFPDVFSPLYISMIQAGEESGRLSEILNQLSQYLEKSFSLRSRVISALVYPTVVLLVALGVLFLFLTYIVPRFSSLFEAYGGNLPGLTVAVINIGNFLKQNFLLIIFIISLLTIAFLVAYRHSIELRKYIQRLLVSIPIIGKLIKVDMISRFSKTMAILLDSGVVLIDAISLASSVTGNYDFVGGMQEVIEGLRVGRKLTELLTAVNLFPPMVLQMVKVGEETGTLKEMFEKISEYYESELENSINVVMSLLSPVLVVIVGIIIGFLVISLFLPIFSISQLLSR